MKRFPSHLWLGQRPDLYALLLAAVCAALPARPAQAAASAAIVLRPQDVATGAQVTLGDIADISAPDPMLQSRLRQVVLGAAPRAGSVVTLSRQELGRWVRAKTGLLDDQVSWAGSTGTAIRGMASAVSLSGLEQTARQALEAWLQPFSEKITLVPLAPPPDLVLPPGPLQYRARPFAPGTVPGKRMQVWVDVWQAGRFARAAVLEFEVAALAPAWVAREALAAGSRPPAQAFELREIDLARVRRPFALQRDPVRPFGAPGQVRLRHRLAPGDALAADDIDAMPAVARGDTVHMSLRSGAVMLEAQAKALQDGSIGQLVSVRLAAAENSIQARVTGAGTVEVQ
jgi:flagella basal body P-ring formation protein FlgA